MTGKVNAGSDSPVSSRVACEFTTMSSAGPASSIVAVTAVDPPLARYSSYRCFSFSGKSSASIPSVRLGAGWATGTIVTPFDAGAKCLINGSSSLNKPPCRTTGFT